MLKNKLSVSEVQGIFEHTLQVQQQFADYFPAKHTNKRQKRIRNAVKTLRDLNIVCSWFYANSFTIEPIDYVRPGCRVHLDTLQGRSDAYPKSFFTVRSFTNKYNVCFISSTDSEMIKKLIRFGFILPTEIILPSDQPNI